MWNQTFQNIQNSMKVGIHMKVWIHTLPELILWKFTYITH